MSDNDVMSIAQFRARFGLGRTTVYHMLRRGQLKAHKIGRRVVLLPEDVQQFIAFLPVRGEVA